MKRLVIILMLLVVVPVMATDKTPYKFLIGGNTYSGSRDASITWLSDRYDGIVAYGDWPLLADSMLDTIAGSKHFLFGPYASSQEVNLFAAAWIDSSYAARIADADPFWQVYYMQRWMDSVRDSLVLISSADSIKYDIESLYVHWNETTIDQSNPSVGDGGERRSYAPNALGAPYNRFSYQYWNNTVSDGYIYPGGYVWLHNGYSVPAREALGYAFVRHFIEDSATYGSGEYHYNAFFSDNQYSGAQAPRLYTYYTIHSTSGGPTTYMDWIEQDSIGTTAGCAEYYNYSTLLGDSAIRASLNAKCDAAGFTDSVIQFINCNKYDHEAFKAQIKHASVSFELIFPYNGADWRNWRNMIWNQDTLQARNVAGPGLRRYSFWECRTNVFVDEGSWNTSDRLYYGLYAWFLTFQESNMYLLPVQFSQTANWATAWEVDLGDRLDVTFDTTDFTGSIDGWGYGTGRFVIQCKYLNGADTGITMYRTAYGGDPGVASDGIWVDLHNGTDTSWYYKVDVDADTSGIAICSTYLLPAQGFLGVQAVGGDVAPVISAISPDETYKDSTDAVSATVQDGFGVNHIWTWIWHPDSTPGANDSISVFDSAYSTGDTAVTWNPAHDYTWPDSGNFWIVFVATDDSGNTGRDSLLILADVEHNPPTIANITPTYGYEDSTDNITADITDNAGTKYVICWIFDPDDDSNFVDSIEISPVDADTTPVFSYTWADSGNHYIVWKAIDEEPASTIESLLVTISVQGVAESSIEFNWETGLIDANSSNQGSNQDNNYGASVALYNSQEYYHGYVVDYSMDDSLNDDWTLDSIQFIWRSEGLSIQGGDSIYLFLASVADNRDWAELELTHNNFKNGAPWTTPGGDTVNCISDTTPIVLGDFGAGTYDTITIHRNTTGGDAYLDSCKYTTGNFGFAIIAKAAWGADGSEIVYMTSKDHGTAAYRPRLIAYPHSSPIADLGVFLIKGLTTYGTTYRR